MYFHNAVLNEKVELFRDEVFHVLKQVLKKKKKHETYF